jgi:apolipoprotein N-acyltransferase
MAFPKFFKSTTFLYAAFGAVLLWAALPPLDFWPLAWIAPVPWIMLIRRKELVGPKPYLALWTVGFAFWLAALHWLRLPHPLTSIGWIALSFYFAFYVPVFIGLSRIALHQLRWPVLLAAPVVWAGLELARAHVLTGMSMGDIAHTQYRWIELIQIADLAGEYGVAFLIVFVAACFARMLPCEEKPRVFWSLIPAAAMLAAVLAYGYWRTANVAAIPGPRISLIQGSIDAKFGGDAKELRENFYGQYYRLSQEALKKYQHVDLIVWPEIFFIEPLVALDTDAGDNDPLVKNEKLSGPEWRKRLGYWVMQIEQAFTETTGRLKTPILVGLDTQHFTAEGVKFFNSAAYVSKTGKLLGRYDKMHLVMFGEYTPLTDLFPWIYKLGLTPLSGNMTPGKEPVAFELEFSPNISPSQTQRETIRIAPNICYESVLSHVIRGQINTLQEKGREPDLLINLSNDGWFWGSSELDMHFACGVFRAVECRKPFLIAANTGFSGSIDANGRVRSKGPRHAKDILLAEVQLDSRHSFYLQHGDWPAGSCLVCCIFFALVGCWHKHHQTVHEKQH